MKRIAKVKNGVCVQVFEELDTFTPDASNGQVDTTEIHAGPGWLYDGSSWTAPYSGKVVADLKRVSKSDFLNFLLHDDEQDALLSANAKAESKDSPTLAQLATRRLMFHLTMADAIDLTSPKLEELILAIKPLLAGDWRSLQIIAGQEPTASAPKSARGVSAKA